MNRFNKFLAATYLSPFQRIKLRSMRRSTTGLVLVAAASVLSFESGYAQNKTACPLFNKADVEAVMGVTFHAEAPDPYSCSFTNWWSANPPPPPRPPKVVELSIEVHYSPAPDPHAVDEARKQVDEQTYEDPTDVPGLGDAAFCIYCVDHLANVPDHATLFVFRGGTMQLVITGGQNVGLEQAKALALKVLGTLGASGKTDYVYGDQTTAFKKPVLNHLGPKPSRIDQLRHDLSAKADAGDTKAQLALGKLYQYGTLTPDGSAKPDYSAAAYWYQRASDRGEAQAACELAVIYRDGLGVAANPATALNLFRKAAEAGYVPAMAPLSYAYAAARTATSRERANYWATKSSEAGDSEGWLTMGYLYNKGLLGGEEPFWYTQAMYAYRKSADGGNCIAMLNIGALYLNGNGVVQDRTQAQAWFAKSAACEGHDLDWVREKAAEYQQKAVAGAGPAFDPSIYAAKRGSDASDGKKLLAGLAALLALSVANDILHPPPVQPSDAASAEAGRQQAIKIMNNFNRNMATITCEQNWGLGRC